MLTGRYDGSLVLVSLLVAVFASFTALSIAGRVKHTEGYFRMAWVLAGAVAMGTGIWAMHFIGMLAFSLPIPLGYDIPLTALSLLIPIAVSAVALWQLRSPDFVRSQLGASAVLFGAGVNSMHYTGMGAMRMQPGIEYDPFMFALSVAIAIGCAWGALWIAFWLKVDAGARRGVQLLAAIVMGVGIAGMHYTGMAAAAFVEGSVCMAASEAISQHTLAILVTIATMAILVVALLAAVFDKRLQQRSARLAASEQLASERADLLEREFAARQELERLSRLKDEFLMTVSHELRTPLNSILGWSQLMVQNKALSDTMLRKGLATIERNARAQAQLIDDLLDMGKILSGKVRVNLQLVAATEFVTAAVETLRPSAISRRLSLRVDLGSDPGFVLCDVARMQQVVWNLLSNAIKFTEPGGEVQISLRSEAGYVRIQVRDSGVGIAPAFLPHVFEAFRQADTSTTRNQGGLGLGLSIARQLVELNGGSISVSSCGEGKGAVFTVRLPQHEPLPEGLVSGVAPGGYEQPRPDMAAYRILLVDDNADSLEIVQEILASAGAAVLTARTPLDALARIDLGGIDLLISDIGMPGLDGYELVRRVRASPVAAVRSLPAIALSAFARKEDREKALACGYTDYLVKPVSAALLVDGVASALKSARVARPAPG